MKVKIQLEKQNLYLSIIGMLKVSTNLTKIQKKLSISKQKLNYYLRELKSKGLIIQKGRGWYEPVKGSKNSIKYGTHLVKDSSRGHAYVWMVKLPKEIEGWNKRIERLEKKGIHFNLVGALKTTPRIKALGRKVWLCNDHLRIFDKPKQSYYGKTAKESKSLAHMELLNIIRVLENKLGFLFKPLKYSIQKEHYALIRNDLAIDQNRKGIIMRIKDENGEEFLLLDDSLEKGGELETVGKGAYKNNIPLQKWWIEQKEDGFKTTPTKIKKEINELRIETLNQIKESSKVSMNVSLIIKQLESNIKGLTELVYLQQQEIRGLKK